jgi:hypothetical protein
MRMVCLHVLQEKVVQDVTLTSEPTQIESYATVLHIQPYLPEHLLQTVLSW